MQLSILLINPPNETAPSETLDPPLGLSYIASVLIRMGHNVYGIDFNFGENPWEKIEKMFRAKNINIVGLTSVTSNYHYVERISKYIRELSKNTLIIYGGIHATFNIEDILSKNNNVDLIVYGEGESTIEELVRKYPDSLHEIEGIAYRHNGKIIINPIRRLISNIDIIPFPSREIFPIKKYSQIHIISSRGCPYNCIFCNSSKMWGNIIRYRNIENVIDEIEKIQKTYRKVKIFIADDLFLIDKKRIHYFCNEIERRKIHFKWSCLSRVDNVSEELLKRIKKNGCEEISYGCESGSNKILKVCNKNISTEDIKNAIRITKKVGISCRTSWIIGLPYETKNTLLETAKLIIETKPNIVIFYFAIPYHGTDLHLKKDELEMRLLTDESKEYFTGSREPLIIPKNLELNELKSTLLEIIEILKNNGYDTTDIASKSLKSDLILSTNFLSSSMHWKE